MVQSLHRGGAVAYFIVLHFRNVDEDLGCRVVELDGFEDGCAVIGDSDILCGPSGKCKQVRK